ASGICGSWWGFCELLCAAFHRGGRVGPLTAAVWALPPGCGPWHGRGRGPSALVRGRDVVTEQVVPSGTPAPLPHPPRRRLWRWLKALLLVVVLLVGLMAGLLALALFNEATGRWVLAQLPRWLPALTLEQVNGTLADGLEIVVLRWE